MTDRRKRRFFRAKPTDRQRSFDDDAAFANYKAERERLDLVTPKTDDVNEDQERHDGLE